MSLKLTQENYLKKVIEKYNDIYLYDKLNYTGIFNYITITCKKHGDFNVRARNFLRGTVCQKCNDKFNHSNDNVSKLEFFIEKSNIIHNNKYNYLNSNYINCDTKIEIVCNKHGSFFQTPYCHLKGNGCKKCAVEKWNIEYNIPNKNESIKNNWLQKCNNNAFLYIIECSNENESFIKIGITKHKNLNKRFSHIKALPYNYKIIKILENKPVLIWELEKKLLNLFKDYKYIPKIKFKGMYECLNKSILNKNIWDIV